MGRFTGYKPERLHELYKSLVRGLHAAAHTSHTAHAAHSAHTAAHAAHSAHGFSPYIFECELKLTTICLCCIYITTREP